MSLIEVSLVTEIWITFSLLRVTRRVFDNRSPTAASLSSLTSSIVRVVSRKSVSLSVQHMRNSHSDRYTVLCDTPNKPAGPP